MKKMINDNTGLLVRIDDVAENMNWKYMDKCEKLFDKINVKPLVGIIPENKDPSLLNFPKNPFFWQRVKKKKKKGWEISMHGFNHLYDSKTKFKDYFGYGGDSEFFGHNYDHQFKKIKLGKEKLLSEGLKVNSFFAPNHTYDKNTFLALSNNNIEVIIDGYGLFPYSEHNLTFIPQLFYKETIMLPFGLQSTQIHLNNWEEKYFNKFQNFLVKNKSRIMTYHQVLNKTSNSKLKTLIRNFLKLTLLNVRKFRN